MTAEARMKGELGDLEKIGTKLAECSPFWTDPSLRNIVNGVVAAEDVTVHEYDCGSKRHAENDRTACIYILFYQKIQSQNTRRNLSC